jgi:hypothetical protein
MFWLGLLSGSIAGGFISVFITDKYLAAKLKKRRV